MLNHCNIKKLFFLVSIFFCLKTYSQELGVKQIVGYWKVNNHKFLVRNNITSDDEKKEFEKDERLCLDSSFISIREDSIFAIPKNNCFFIDCNSALTIKKSLKVIENSYENYISTGDEIIEGNVSKRFLKIIGLMNFTDSVIIFDTNCNIDYGSETLKIFIIDKDNIVLYRSVDLLFLSKASKRNLK